MTWMLTKTGKTVDLQFMAGPIDLEDIAWSLSTMYRFNGHTTRPYSVLEHSLIVLEIMVCHLHITDPVALKAGLMHDAHEAYTGDMTQPMKQVVGRAWAEAEHQVQHAVLLHFGLATAYASHREVIRAADLHALSTERLQLMHPDGPVWAVTDAFPPLAWLDLRAMASWPREALIDAFLTQFHSLTERIRAQQMQVLVRPTKGTP